MNIPIIYKSSRKKNIKVDVEVLEWERFIDYDTNRR